MNGKKKRMIPTANVTEEGTFVPKIPGEGAEITGDCGEVDCGSVIRKFYFKILLSLQPNNDN